MLDPLGVVTKTRTAIEEEEAGLAEAPSTIAQREELQRLQKDNYFYIPDIGTVPELVVPDFLPNLLGKIVLLLIVYNNLYQDHLKVIAQSLVLTVHRILTTQWKDFILHTLQ